MATRKGEEADLAAAVAEARALARRALGDAAAHARNVLSEALRDAPEGRATAAKARRNRSYHAAMAKLDGLLADLTQLVGDFRGRTYVEEYRHWTDYLPARVLRVPPGNDPPARLIDRARAAMVHGLTPRQAIRPAIVRAKQSLLPALTVAGNRATPRRDAGDHVGLWARRSASAVEAIARSVLVDSQTLAHRLAGRDAIRPELLHPDPSLPEPVA